MNVCIPGDTCIHTGPTHTHTTSPLESSWVSTGKVILKILQARLQQYVNCELPDIQVEFRKGRRTRDPIANIHWITEKQKEFQRNICFVDYVKAFVWVTTNCGKFLNRWEYQTDHLTCLLRNLYAGQEATVRTRHRTDWLLGKEHVM